MKYLIFIGIYALYSCNTDLCNIKNATQNTKNEFTEDTTITVEWLGQSCFCPNWIEIKHIRELRNDSLGIIKNQFSIALLPSDTLNDLHNHPLIGKQTPLVFKLKGRFFENEIEHISKGKSFTARTFQYDSFQMIEY